MHKKNIENNILILIKDILFLKLLRPISVINKRKHENAIKFFK